MLHVESEVSRAGCGEYTREHVRDDAFAQLTTLRDATADAGSQSRRTLATRSAAVSSGALNDR